MDAILLYDTKYRYLVDVPDAETGRAVQMRGVWLPRSQMRYVEPNVFEVPDWLVDKHLAIFCDNGTPSLRRARVLEMREEIRTGVQEHTQKQLRAVKPPMDDDFLGV